VSNINLIDINGNFVIIHKVIETNLKVKKYDCFIWLFFI